MVESTDSDSSSWQKSWADYRTPAGRPGLALTSIAIRVLKPAFATLQLSKSKTLFAWLYAVFGFARIAVNRLLARSSRRGLLPWPLVRFVVSCRCPWHRERVQFVRVSCEWPPLYWVSRP